LLPTSDRSRGLPPEQMQGASCDFLLLSPRTARRKCVVHAGYLICFNLPSNQRACEQVPDGHFLLCSFR
jgi:hypothetical protein